MGYTTDFNGKLSFSAPLTPEQVLYINTFSGTRRMKRDVSILNRVHGGAYGFNGSYGNEGEYFAKDDGDFGQTEDESVIAYNDTPGSIEMFSGSDIMQTYSGNRELIKRGIAVPSLWCKWIVTEDGKYLEWSGEENFYNYVEWLEYLIVHFFNVYKTKLNGTIQWQGEEYSDNGLIIVNDSIVITSELND